MQIKHMPFILLACLITSVYAEQASNTAAKPEQQPVEKDQSKKQERSAEKVKQSRKSGQAFIPSEQVSADVPVDFPGDI